MSATIPRRTPANIIGIGGAALLVALGAVACSATPTTIPASERPLARGNHCAPTADLVPACGVWWGYAAVESGPAAFGPLEGELGRRFDLVYRFHDLDDVVPDADERALIERGTLLHVSIVPTDFSDPGARTGGWTAVAAGHYDEQLRRQAQGIASLGVPVFVTFDHEPDQPAKLASGSAADFRAAWRHVHELYSAAGATNTVWVWVVLGWPETFRRALSMWPGNDVVDWISWDVYNAEGCRSGVHDPARRIDLETGIRVFEDWLLEHGPGAGIDTGLPVMISEAGSTLQAGETSAEWYADIPWALAAHPRVRAVTLWSARGNGTCDYRFTESSEVTAAVRSAGLDPWITSGTAPNPFPSPERKSR